MAVTRRSQRLSTQGQAEADTHREEAAGEDTADRHETEDEHRQPSDATGADGAVHGAVRRVLRHSSGSGGRLSRVDDVLHRLKRQRERTEAREWLDDEQRLVAGEDEEQAEAEAEAQTEQRRAGGGDGDSDGLTSVPRKRQRSQRSRRTSHRSSAADEYDDGSGFVVYSDEDAHEEAVDEDDSGSDTGAAGEETIAHMRLHNQLQRARSGSVSDDEDEDDGQGMTGTAMRVRSKPHSAASSPWPALFSLHRSQSPFGPVLSLDAAFHYWAQYLAAVLVDDAASAAVLTSSSARCVLSAVKVVEEQFDSRLANWVKPSTWEQRGMERFHTAVTQLPYITSRRLNTYDAISEDTQQTDAAPADSGSLSLSSGLCDTCRGQHQATHYVELFGVPYDFQRLTHPFDNQRIFACPTQTQTHTRAHALLSQHSHGRPT